MSLHYCHPSESVELFQKSLCGITKLIQSDHQQRLQMMKTATVCCTQYSCIQDYSNTITFLNRKSNLSFDFVVMFVFHAAYTAYTAHCLRLAPMLCAWVLTSWGTLGQSEVPLSNESLSGPRFALW